MAKLTRFPLDDGEAVLVEIEPDGPDIEPAGRGRDLIESATTSFGAALRPVRQAAVSALEQFREMDGRPDEIEIEFGVRLNAQAGAVIAKSGVDGHLKIKLTWKRAND